MRRRLRRRSRGFTLIELMVSLLISSLLVVLLLSVFARMSFAYREQQQVVSIHQVMSAARAAFDRDAKLAGLYMAQGFTIAADWNASNEVVRSPLAIINHADQPDEVRFYYADGDTVAVVTSTLAPSKTQVSYVTRDDHPGFAVGDLVVMSTPSMVPSPIDPDDGRIVVWSACVLEIEAVAGGQMSFSQAGDWGRAGNDHCTTAPVASTPWPGPQGGTIVAKLVARAWRIDRSSTARMELGALQMDPTGALIDDSGFQDQAYGVVDLQVATSFYDGNGVDTDDPDDDGNRDWESSDEQETNTQARAVGVPFIPPMMISISLLARTTANVEGVRTAATPDLVDPTNVDHNTIGDRPSQMLPSATDPALIGGRVYRHVTFHVDLRNTGVGR